MFKDKNGNICKQFDTVIMYVGGLRYKGLPAGPGYRGIFGYFQTSEFRNPLS